MVEGDDQIQLSERQEKIVEIVKEHGPITGEFIGKMLNVTRATLRPDLSILTRSGIIEARPRVGYYYSKNNDKGIFFNSIHRIRVKDIKSVPVVVRDDISVYDAVVRMFTEDVGTLTVVDNRGVLQGLVSRKDLLKIAIGKGDISTIPVNIIMTRMPNIVSTTNEETAFMAAKKIIEHEIDALPVVKSFIDDNGEEHLKVVGRITKTNLAKILVELGEG